MPVGEAKAAVATAMLPLCATAVVMAVTAKVGAQTTINNQIKAATETATQMVKMTATTKQMATATPTEEQWQCGGGSQLGGDGGSLARVWHWQRRQHGCRVGSGKMDRVIF